MHRITNCKDGKIFRTGVSQDKTIFLGTCHIIVENQDDLIQLVGVANDTSQVKIDSSDIGKNNDIASITGANNHIIIEEKDTINTMQKS